MDKDKKAAHGRISFVLPERIGSVVIRNLTAAVALNTLAGSDLAPTLCPEKDKDCKGSD